MAEYLLENASKPKEDTSLSLQKFPKRFRLPTDQKLMFYLILKRFLQEPKSLQDGQWDQEQFGPEKYTFVYGKENCNISVIDFKGDIQEGVVATLDIYLNWRGVTYANLSDLQRVQNELRVLGFRNEKVDACFFLAKQQLAKKPSGSVQILCDDVDLLFSAKGKHEIVVTYDDKKNAPICTISVKKK